MYCKLDTVVCTKHQRKKAVHERKRKNFFNLVFIKSVFSSLKVSYEKQVT